jgi:phage terminase small subunit
MADNLTPKQEAFCRKYIETGNASEAYRQSYDAEGMNPNTINRKAKELLDNGKIKARIAEIQERHLKRHNVTVDSLVEELQEARELAKQISRPEVMINATLGKAKITGNIIEKSELTGKDGGPIVVQTKEQRDAAVAAALAADS